MFLNKARGDEGKCCRETKTPKQSLPQQQHPRRSKIPIWKRSICRLHGNDHHTELKATEPKQTKYMLKRHRLKAVN
jgi:hypothetical protein